MKALIKASWLAMLFVVIALVRTTLVVAQTATGEIDITAVDPARNMRIS